MTTEDTTALPADPLLAWLYAIWGVDAEWAQTGATSFTWWPGRFAQRVERLPSRAPRATRVRARTVLTEDVRDPRHARAILSLLNAGSAGYAFHLDGTGTRVLLDTVHTVREDAPEQRAVFAQAAIVQAIVAHQVAPALLQNLGSAPVASSHPLSGDRSRPDEMLTLLEAGWARPEQALGTGLTIADVAGMASVLAERAGVPVGDQPGGVTMLDGGRLACLELPFAASDDAPTLTGGSHCRVTAGQSDHPDLGRTLSLVVAAPLVLDPETSCATADQLNRAAAEGHHDRSGLGAWWSRDGQLCWSTHIPFDVAPAFASAGYPARAAQLATLVTDVSAGRGLETAKVSQALGQPAAPGVQPWRGLGHEPDYPLTVFPDRAIARNAMAQHLQKHPDSGLTVPLADLGPQPDLTLATWGIFNPVGPTLTTLGLISTDSGWLFAEWMRHPLAPLYRVHALLEHPDDSTVAAACQQILIQTYGDPDRCPVPIGLPEFCLAPPPDGLGRHATAALLTIAETRCDARELVGTAALYDAFQGDAWARMNAPSKRYDDITADLSVLEPAQAAARWWEAASRTSHVAGHATAFASAWDGALRFLAEATTRDDLRTRP